MERRAKIVATIGPASQERAMLRQLFLAGMDVARLNFSHGSHEVHRTVFNTLRELAAETGLPITIMQDIQGPKIRIGELLGGKVQLETGQFLTLTTRALTGTAEKVSVDFKGLPELVKPGNRILIDDGNLELMVVEPCPGGLRDECLTRVTLGGDLKPHKGVNLPGLHLDIPALTEKDESDLAFGLELGVDALAVSFVRRAEDLQLVHRMIERHASRHTPPLVIAKLERPEALDNLEGILQEAEGVMVARGDLGVEMAPEMVPIAQKRIIEQANQRGKVVITATQMLESMIHQPRPTRAEANDVANAIFDGTDAVMLSGETAVGSYPVQAVSMMSAIVVQAEEHMRQWGRWGGNVVADNPDDDTYYITRAATELARDRNVAGLASFTETGRTARLLSKERAGVPIWGCTPNEDTYWRLNIFWGVEPIRMPLVDTIDGLLQSFDQVLQEKHALKTGQQVVLTFGYPIRRQCPTNMAYLHTIGSSH